MATELNNGNPHDPLAAIVINVTDGEAIVVGNVNVHCNYNNNYMKSPIIID